MARRFTAKEAQERVEAAYAVPCTTAALAPEHLTVRSC